MGGTTRGNHNPCNHLTLLASWPSLPYWAASVKGPRTPVTRTRVKVAPNVFYSLTGPANARVTLISSRRIPPRESAGSVVGSSLPTRLSRVLMATTRGTFSFPRNSPNYIGSTLFRPVPNSLRDRAGVIETLQEKADTLTCTPLSSARAGNRHFHLWTIYPAVASGSTLPVLQ